MEKKFKGCEIQAVYFSTHNVCRKWMITNLHCFWKLSLNLVLNIAVHTVQLEFWGLNSCFLECRHYKNRFYHLSLCISDFMPPERYQKLMPLAGRNFTRCLLIIWQLTCLIYQSIFMCCPNREKYLFNK